MKTEFVPKLVATVTVLCALYVVLAASDKLVTVKSLASIGYFDALVRKHAANFPLIDDVAIFGFVILSW